MAQHHVHDLQVFPDSGFDDAMSNSVGMSLSTLWEVLGYAAMVLVTVSLMMRSIVRLRWINLAGAALFVIYGFAIEAYPVAILNLAVVGINLYHLWHMHRRIHESFAVAAMPPDSAYVTQFIEFHRQDITRTQPAAQTTADANVMFVLRDTVPAGVLAVGPPDARGVGQVQLDFATPQYRDLKVGTYLFHTSDALQSLGYRTLVTAPGTAEHRRYLEKMGFTGDDAMRLELTPT